MPDSEVNVSIDTNNQELEKILLSNKVHPEIKFDKNKSTCSYQIFLIDLLCDLSHISQDLIDSYGHCQEHGQKIAVIILHRDTIDIEKNHYFQKMLDDLGKDKPLHRLIYTKDVYQTLSSLPVTSFDKKIFTAVSNRNLIISEKGDNLYFPLSLEDFVSAVIKTLFLANTAGKIFWLLGDPITDLEFTFLLKKELSSTDKDDLEINATGKDDPKTNSLLSLGNSTRAQLNWQPDSDIVDSLKKITDLYADTPNAKEDAPIKTNRIHQLISWAYRRRSERISKLPTIKVLLRNLLLIVLLIMIFLGGISTVATGISLRRLESSIQAALNGDLISSVRSLDTAIKYKEIGEANFGPLIPVADLIFPQATEKIFNLYKFIDYALASLGNLHQTYVMAENLLLSLNKSDNKINYDDFGLALHSNLIQVYENLNQIVILTDGNKLPSFLDKKIKENPKFVNLKTLEGQVAEYIKVVDLIPAILSQNKIKNIFILLQNSQSADQYLLLTLNQGKLISKKYFTKDDLNIGDSQDPDFSAFSNTLSTNLEENQITKPDFIIAVNDLLIKQLLSEEKLPTTIPADYQELFDQYLDRLFSQRITLPILGRTLAKIIGDGQIYLWSADPDIERQIALQSYSGALVPHPCNAGIGSAEKCIAQTTYLNESIDSSGKIYPWSSRLVNHIVDITPSLIQHKYLLDYKPNEATDSATTVDTLYHLYLPSPSTLDKVLVNDLPTSMKGFIKEGYGVFDHYQVPLVLNTGQSNSIVIIASTPLQLPFSTPFSYSITEYRQLGTTDPGIGLTINYPENLKPSVVTSPFSANPSQIKLNFPPHTFTFGLTLEQITQ